MTTNAFGPPKTSSEALTAAAPDAFTARMHEISHLVAFDPGSWSQEMANEVRSIFDLRAENWFIHETDAYLAPLDAALQAGEIVGRHCLDIGSGTAIHETTLASRFDHVTAVDFSLQMLRNAKRGQADFVLADAAQLPFADHSADAIVLVNMFLFAAESARVLKPEGSLVFVSTRANETPIYLDPGDVAAAMTRLDDSSLVATTGATGPGCWTIVRRRTNDQSGKGAR